MGNKKQLFGELAELDNLQKELMKRRKKAIVKCDHQKNGKLRLIPRGNGEFGCELCGEEFSMTPMKANVIEEAAEILHDAIQQIRVHAKEGEEEIVTVLGKLDFNIREVPELYRRSLDENIRGKGKKNKNKNRNRDGFGNFDRPGQVSFLGGGGNGNKGKRFK